MLNTTIATSTSLRSGDVQRRLGQLDRVVEQLRALERSRDGAHPRGGALSDAARAWEREARATRRRLTGSTRLPPTRSSKEGIPMTRTAIRR